MSRSRLLVASLLSAAMLVFAEAPTWAHGVAGSGPGIEGIAPDIESASPRDVDAHLPGLILMAAPLPAPVPWPALLGVLTVFALGWRRPRSDVAIALVLLLAVFAFEDGLHSVHHGFDKSQVASCPTAAVAAHLSATGVDAVLPCDVILPVVAIATEPGQPAPIARLSGPEQGRAPPSSLL